MPQFSMFVQWLWQWLTRNVKNAISFRWLWKSWKLLRRLGPRTDPGQGDTGGTLIASYNPQPSWSSTAPVVVCESRVPAMVPPIHIHSAPSNTNAEVTIYRPSSPRLLYPHRLSAASRSSPDLGPYSSNFSSASDSCSNLCVTPERPLVASRSCTTLRSDWGSVCSKPATSESEQSHTHGAHIAVPSRLSTGGETDANSGCSTLLDQDHRAIPAGECNIPFRKPRCIKPADVKRYHRNGRVRLRDYDGDPVKIAANTRLFPSSNGPAGWKPQTHVEGARYYLHSNKACAYAAVYAQE
ncbi:hypothetical protein NEOLEDRAFT_891173 [Neolentinus lepideus HHB14362 ss-1]|uniref:Uncharacterized protein n=1 Tax=Neolentinus lepideus HHB14362 ss-1 TaxID=1314782 RepID=A0A165NT82_9AGAM|nr:hypothetical protein NEOLEDRAFT_891173 [Neolentinus lepideus HHB14362 ss-1]